MNLLEHEAKKLLEAARIAIPQSSLIAEASSAPFLPAVLKSQVPIGGRGKAGGVVVVTTESEWKTALTSLFSLSIKGHLPASLLAEELLTINKEYYLAVMVDRASSSIQLVAHLQGGIDVESSTHFQHWTLDGPDNAESVGQALADYYDLADKTFVLQDIVEKLYHCLIDNDALLVEINPLILTAQGEMIAGDAKITLDDNAAFRHEWSFSQEAVDTNFVTIDPQGAIATIANGAGLAMATVDAAYDTGLVPANFLDIGGGANTATLLKAFHRIVEYRHIQAIVINIFAGITRSDEVAKAIIAAREQIPHLPPLFIRIAGTNDQEARELLQQQDIPFLDSLEACLEAAKEAMHG